MNELETQHPFVELETRHTFAHGIIREIPITLLTQYYAVQEFYHGPLITYDKSSKIINN